MGLSMEKLEKDWNKHPILHLDLNIEKYDTLESLDNILEKSLTAWEKLYGAEPLNVPFPCVLQVLYSVHTRKPGNALPSWWMNTTSPCCNPS